jgi:hypothetical protein
MAQSRNKGLYGLPTYNQAEKIITKFGGESSMAKLIGTSRISIYRWQYRRPYGSDGLIPTTQIDRIKEIARLEGILLTSQDWEPTKIQYDDETLALRERMIDLLTNKLKSANKDAPELSL